MKVNLELNVYEVSYTLAYKTIHSDGTLTFSKTNTYDHVDKIIAKDMRSVEDYLKEDSKLREIKSITVIDNIDKVLL